MASSNKRLNGGGFPNARYEFTQLSWAAAVSSAKTATLSNLNMLVDRIDALFSTTTDNVTVTFTLTDQNSVVVATFTALADATNHMKLSTTATPDFPAIPLADDTLTLSATLSAVPGTSGATLDVILRGP